MRNKKTDIETLSLSLSPAQLSSFTSSSSSPAPSRTNGWWVIGHFLSPTHFPFLMLLPYSSLGSPQATIPLRMSICFSIGSWRGCWATSAPCTEHLPLLLRWTWCSQASYFFPHSSLFSGALALSQISFYRGSTSFANRCSSDPLQSHLKPTGISCMCHGVYAKPKSMYSPPVCVELRNYSLL